MILQTGPPFLAPTSQQHVNGFLAQLSQQVPESQVNRTYRLDGKTLATIVDRCAEHLVLRNGSRFGLDCSQDLKYQGETAW